MSEWSERLTAETKEQVIDTLKKEGVADALKEKIRGQIQAMMRDKGIDNSIRDLIRAAAIDVARELLAESMQDLEGRVRKQVNEMFDARVESEAKRLLDDALIAVRKRMAP